MPQTRPGNPRKQWGRSGGAFDYQFTTAGAAQATVIFGDTKVVASNVYGGGGVYTITLRANFSRAILAVSLESATLVDQVAFQQTMSTTAPCTIVVTTVTNHVAAQLTGPIVHIHGTLIP